MELVIYNPTDDQFLKEINFNFEEIKTELINKLEKYQGLVYSDEEIAKAKKDRAGLNSFKKVLNDRKIEIKKKCLEAYAVFEDQVKELFLLLDKPILEIDGQIKKVEEKAREKKREMIKALYDEYVGDLEKLVPFENIFIESWLNVTVKLKDIENDIKLHFKTTIEDLDTIEKLNSENPQIIKDIYLKTFDLGEALRENQRLIQQKKDLEEREEKNKIREAQELADKNKKQAVKVSAPAPGPIQEATEKAEQIYTELLEIKGTASQMKRLRDYLDANNFEYMRCKDASK